MNKGMDITMQLETQRLKVKVKPVEPESPVLGSILGLFVSLAL